VNTSSIKFVKARQK